jgi:hypothetical protein
MHTFVVGDVHGCLGELERLLARAGVGPGDRLILAGDLVMKGPDSQGVVQLARERRALSVRGNHDAHVLKARAGVALKKHQRAVADTLGEADWRYLEAMPLWLRLPELGAVVVHAGVLPGLGPEHTPSHLLMNMRSIGKDGKGTPVLEGGVPWASLWSGPELIVFGHDAVRGLQEYPLALGLDTGCCYGKHLTGVWLPERRLVRVEAAKVWSVPTP